MISLTRFPFESNFAIWQDLLSKDLEESRSHESFNGHINVKIDTFAAMLRRFDGSCNKASDHILICAKI